MKKLLLLFAMACVALGAAAQHSFPPQDFHYNVNYKWGIIDVMIARGVVTIQSNNGNFYGTLDGTSIPWEGKIICVSDTLSANMTTQGGQWVEDVTYQNGWYRHPAASSFNSGTYNPADPAIYKNIAGGGAYDASNDSMEAITITSDMLGLFYYAKYIDFPALKPGQWFSIPINGGFADKVQITYDGQSTYTANGDTYPTYDISFQYSYQGALSAYPVTCKISATDRIPVFISASLPVGRVEMLYEP